MKEKITVVVVEREGAVVSTVVREVNAFTYGYGQETFRWWTGLGHDKDQSPTGYWVQVYEPHPRLSGLFQGREVLNHWDGPVEGGVVDALMAIVCVRLGDNFPAGNGLKKEHVGEFLLRVLKATRPTEGERSPKGM